MIRYFIVLLLVSGLTLIIPSGAQAQSCTSKAGAQAKLSDRLEAVIKDPKQTPLYIDWEALVGRVVGYKLWTNLEYSDQRQREVISVAQQVAVHFLTGILDDINGSVNVSVEDVRWSKKNWYFEARPDTAGKPLIRQFLVITGIWETADRAGSFNVHADADCQMFNLLLRADEYDINFDAYQHLRQNDDVDRYRK